MKDEDIIKALECCIRSPHRACKNTNCPYFLETIKYSECQDQLISDAKNLINRQKAKIEALEMDNAQLQSDNFKANMNCEHLQAEIERLKGWDRWIVSESHAPIIKKARAEAIKEFAERLEEYSYESMGNYGIRHMVVSVKDIDNIVKEMEKKYEIS